MLNEIDKLEADRSQFFAWYQRTAKEQGCVPGLFDTWQAGRAALLATLPHESAATLVGDMWK